MQRTPIFKTRFRKQVLLEKATGRTDDTTTTTPQPYLCGWQAKERGAGIQCNHFICWTKDSEETLAQLNEERKALKKTPAPPADPPKYNN